MGCYCTDVVFANGELPDFSVIQASFEEKTGLPLLVSYHAPTAETIQRYERMKREVPKIKDLYQLSGMFQVEGFYEVEFFTYPQKIEIQFYYEQKYLPYALLWTLQELGGEAEFRIPSRYKIRWDKRKWYQRIKP